MFTGLGFGDAADANWTGGLAGLPAMRLAEAVRTPVSLLTMELAFRVFAAKARVETPRESAV